MTVVSCDDRRLDYQYHRRVQIDNGGSNPNTKHPVVAAVNHDSFYPGLDWLPLSIILMEARHHISHSFPHVAPHLT